MKVYCLIPTYNDGKFITYTLDSLRNQDYENYEVIIVDDGSTDNTSSIIKEYKKKYDKKNRIKYIYQENKDQLNALKTASKYIKDLNSLTYILHSDDVICDNAFSNAVKYMSENDCDAIISDIIIIDGNNKITGKKKVKKYEKKKYILPLELLWLGRNLYMDTAFFRTDIFLKNVYYNYLTWNGPFWLNLDNNNMCNVKKVNFSFFKYRVFEQNYINNFMGKLCVINGEIRVVTRLLKYYYIPFYNLQYLIYRVFNKIGLESMFRPIYFNKETKNKSKIIKFVLNKRFTDEQINNNLYLSSLIKFYSNLNNRVVTFDNFKDSIIYEGSDLRIFNKNLINDSLPIFYKDILDEMKKGFKTILVNSKDEKEKMDKVIRFLSIYPYVDIQINTNR